jgi:hypothetical protein
MSRSKSKDSLLRSQLEVANRQNYSTQAIEEKIAQSLCQQGEFCDQIDASDLAIIMRNIVYTMFGEFKLSGLELKLLHNVPSVKVAIKNGEARMGYTVHIHKPITAFLSFQYAIVNDAIDDSRKLRLKRGSFLYKERTRRFDLKAKAALAAVNIKQLARKELQDLGQVIAKTLPAQMDQYGVSGDLKRVELHLDGQKLNIRLQGDFGPLPQGQIDQLVQVSAVTGS